MDPLIGTALIGGATSILSGIFGSAGSSYSADRAFEANERTNAMNYRIWQEQQQHNIDMFNMENEANMQNWQTQFNAQNAYNDPSAVYQRYLNAGINPQLAFGSGAGTTAGNAQMKSATAVPAQAPTWQSPSDVAFQSPLQGFMNGALGGLQQLASAYQMFNTGKNQGSQAKTNDALRPFQVRDLTESYGLKIAQAYSNYQQGDLFRNQATLAGKTMDLQGYILNQQLANMRLQNTNLWLDSQSKTIMNAYLPREKQIALEMSSQLLINSYLNGELTKQQIKTEVTKQILNLSEKDVNESEVKVNKAKEVNIVAQTAGQYIANEHATLDYVTASRLADKYIRAKIMAYDADYAENMYRFDTTPRLTPFQQRLSRASNGAGDFFRGLLGGWLPFSASYNVSRGTSNINSHSRSFGVSHNHSYKEY